MRETAREKLKLADRNEKVAKLLNLSTESWAVES